MAVRLGLGASSPPLVEGLHGITWQQPAKRIRATLVVVRALLDGARLPLDRQHVRPLRLGAHWLPFLWARSRLPDGRSLLDEGEAVAERATPTGVAACVPLAIAEDEEKPCSTPTATADDHACPRQQNGWLKM